MQTPGGIHVPGGMGRSSDCIEVAIEIIFEEILSPAVEISIEVLLKENLSLAAMKISIGNTVLSWLALVSGRRTLARRRSHGNGGEACLAIGSQFQ